MCPKSLVLNWVKELSKWLVDRSIVVARAKKLPETGADIVVATYDDAKKLQDTFLGRPWQLVVGDEAHAFKNAKAQRSKAFANIARGAERKLLLTGTPIENAPMELYNLLQILTPNQWGSPIKFGCRYAAGYQDEWGWNFKGASNLQELQDRLRATCMVRRRKADVLKELPPKRRQIILLEPPRGSRDVIAQENEEFAAWEAGVFIDESVELAPGVVDPSKLTAPKYDFSEISEARHALALSKVEPGLEHVRETLESTAKVLVFAHHHDVIDQLVEGLKEFNPVSLTGKHSPLERQEAVERFQNDPTCRVFVGSITAAGVGLTLTAASSVIFIEATFKPSEMTQAEDRAHRIGQRECVHVQHLVFDETLDARMVELLIQKQAIADAALDNEAIVAPLQAEPELTPAQRELQEVANKMTSPLALQIHNALRMLAGMCDGAMTEDMKGFNKLDAAIGQRLARLPKLSAKQAAFGLRIVRKYHRQVGRIEV